MKSKLHIGILAILSVGLFYAGWYAYKSIFTPSLGQIVEESMIKDGSLEIPAGTSTSTPKTNIADLCQAGAFTPPSQYELDFNKHISENSSVRYIRTSLNDYLENNYTYGDHRGLLDGVHYADSAYTELRSMDESYLKSKFIVIQTDTALGGGESVDILFKDNPNQVFYIWVYEYTKEDGSHLGFDFRVISPNNDGPDIKETQKTLINQICNPKMGI